MLESLQQLNWAEVSAYLAVFILIFDRLAKLTPTKKDDNTVSFLYKLFSVLGIKVKDIEKRK